MGPHILINDKFSAHAENLREHFDKRFLDSSSLSGNRFVWDYWHVRDQYTLIRTPAYHYFPKSLYLKFHHELVHWGRKTLGCWDISPPWLSYYVDGCKQELHSDVPHGPWAYVFSLTDWNRREFTGGETFILKPQVLSYWRNFADQKDRELNSFVDRIPAKMNRLIVFDPRYPHGVSEVRGIRDPRKARIVIHGWFMQPKTYVEGHLPAKNCEKTLNQAFHILQNEMSQFPICKGTVSIQMEVGSNRKVTQIRFATNTLQDSEGKPPRALNKRILQIYSSLEFAKSRASTFLTVPLVF